MVEGLRGTTSSISWERNLIVIISHISNLSRGHMNIYATDTDPVTSAQNLDDKRLIKGITDVAVLLSTALRMLDCPSPKIYLAEHMTHPWTVWATKSRGNFQWLVFHGLAMNEEMKFRFPDIKPKVRSTTVILDCSELFTCTCKNDIAGMTPFPNCTNLSGNIGVVKLYRQFMSQTKWGFQTRWTNRGMPDWHKDTLPKKEVA